MVWHKASPLIKSCKMIIPLVTKAGISIAIDYKWYSLINSVISDASNNDIYFFLKIDLLNEIAIMHGIFGWQCYTQCHRFVMRFNITWYCIYTSLQWQIVETYMDVNYRITGWTVKIVRHFIRRTKEQRMGICRLALGRKCHFKRILL